MPENDRICHIYTEDVTWMKFIITGCLTLAWTCLGYFTELLGPFLTTLMHQLSTDYAGIGRALSIRSAGFFTGSLFGGIISDVYTKYLHLLLAVSLSCAALTTAIIPACSALWQFSLIMFVAGIAHGLLSSAGNPLMSHTWTTKASGPFNLMHSGYGIGGAITALLIRLLEDPTKRHSEYLDIKPPMIIATCASGLMALPFILMFIRHSRIARRLLQDDKKVHLKSIQYDDQTRVDVGEKESPPEDELKMLLVVDGGCHGIFRKCQELFGVFVKSLRLWISKTELKQPMLIFYILVIYFCLMGNERVASKFLYTYIQSGGHGTDKEDALLVQSAFWGVYCLGRLIIFVLTFKVKITHLFLVEIFGALVSSACLAFAPRQRDSLISCVLLFGLFKSPLFPSTIGVFGQICRITGFIVLFIDIGSSLGGAVYQIVAAQIIQVYTISAFPYILFGTVLIIVPFSLVLNYLVYKDVKKQLEKVKDKEKSLYH